MNPLVQNMTEVLAWGTLVAHVAIAIGVAILAIKAAGRGGVRLNRLVEGVSRHAVLLGFIVSFGSVVASIFYSNIAGFTPCNLCWWQRVFLFPQAVIFAVALYSERMHGLRDRTAFVSSFILSLIGGATALFQYYGQMFDPGLLAACATQGESCSKLFFVSLGYITIPMMSLTASLVLVLLYLFHRRRA